MCELPASPRKMLPPPITRASSQPSAWTSFSSAPNAASTSGSIPYPAGPASASPLILRSTRRYVGAAAVATAGGSGSGLASSGGLLVVRTPLERFPELEAGEAAHRDVDAEPHDRLFDDLLDGPIALLDERLLEEADVLVEALDLPFDDALDDLLGLAGLPGLREVDLALGLELLRRHVLTAHVARSCSRHLHRQVLHELLELGGLGHEVRLAVDLDQDADFAPRMDVGADRAVRGRAGGLLRRLGEPPLAQQTERAVEVAGRLAERLLAVEEPRPRLLPELLDEGEAHA